MAETLLNWGVMLFSLFVLFALAWLGYRDLRSLGQSRPPIPPSSNHWNNSPTEYVPPPSQLPTNGAAGHHLRVEYEREGRVEHVQTVASGETGYVGTEQLPRMGTGVLVRHLRVSGENGGFSLENRHSFQPIQWEGEEGRKGELSPGEAISVRGEVDLTLGDYRIRCREE